MQDEIGAIIASEKAARLLQGKTWQTICNRLGSRVLSTWRYPLPLNFRLGMPFA